MLSGHYDHWKVLAELEVEEDCDYVDFTNLDINRDWEYYLDVTIKNPTGSTSRYYLFIEGDYTITNYYSQYVYATDTSLSAGRQNYPSVGDLITGERALFNIKIAKDPDGYFRYFVTINFRTGSNQAILLRAGSKTAPVSNITSIRVAAQVSGAIGAGSRFILARVRG